MARLQRAHFGAMPNSSAMKSSRSGASVDDEIGFVLARHLVRRRARGHQAVVQVEVARLDEIDEAGVEAHQAVADVEVLESQIEAEGRTFSHHSRIPQTL